MYEYIFAILVGVVCIAIGIMNSKGKISMLHSYHRKRVKEEDIIPFGKLVGLGMKIIGAGIIVGGVLSIVAYTTENKNFEIVGLVFVVVGLVIGTVLAFYAMKKYNKGIF